MLPNAGWNAFRSAWGNCWACFWGVCQLLPCIEDADSATICGRILRACVDSVREISVWTNGFWALCSNFIRGAKKTCFNASSADIRFCHQKNIQNLLNYWKTSGFGSNMSSKRETKFRSSSEGVIGAREQEWILTDNIEFTFERGSRNCKIKLHLIKL